MRDFADIDLAPSAEFAARLEKQLLRELSEAAPNPQGLIDVRSAETATPSPSLWRRPFLMLATAAALVALVSAVVSTATDDRSRPADRVAPTSSVMVTTVPAAFDELPGVGAELAPGDYSVSRFAVPFTISISDTWLLAKDTSALFVLHRLSGPKMAVTSGFFDGATPAEVIANFCPTVLDLSNPTEAELLNQPALQATARATGTCAFIVAPGTEDSVRLGDEVQITAAIVNGKVVVVVANALWPLWPALEPEINALLASMQPNN